MYIPPLMPINVARRPFLIVTVNKKYPKSLDISCALLFTIMDLKLHFVDFHQEGITYVYMFTTGSSNLLFVLSHAQILVKEATHEIAKMLSKVSVM